MVRSGEECLRRGSAVAVRLLQPQCWQSIDTCLPLRGLALACGFRCFSNGCRRCQECGELYRLTSPKGFQPTVRGVGPGFSYHAGAGIGSITPTLIGALKDRGMTFRLRWVRSSQPRARPPSYFCGWGRRHEAANSWRLMTTKSERSFLKQTKQ